MASTKEDIAKFSLAFAAGIYLDYFTNLYTRGVLALNWIPDIARNTSHDAFLGFYMACSSAIGQSITKLEPNPRKVVINSVLFSIVFLGIIESGQGVLQYLHIIDRGFAWEDYFAYALGAVGFLGLDLTAVGIKLLHDKTKKTSLQNHSS